ncbi:MAG TPA: hypothetical protein VFW58_10765, partial [Trichococcus sp.]|nr:hypothetical protein [Trichococcus sp.]
VSDGERSQSQTVEYPPTRTTTTLITHGCLIFGQWHQLKQLDSCKKSEDALCILAFFYCGAKLLNVPHLFDNFSPT